MIGQSQEPIFGDLLTKRAGWVLRDRQRPGDLIFGACGRPACRVVPAAQSGKRTATSCPGRLRKQAGRSVRSIKSCRPRFEETLPRHAFFHGTRPDRTPAALNRTAGFAISSFMAARASSMRIALSSWVPPRPAVSGSPILTTSSALRRHSHRIPPGRTEGDRDGHDRHARPRAKETAPLEARRGGVVGHQLALGKKCTIRPLTSKNSISSKTPEFDMLPGTARRRGSVP
jgi:hypothetical protein